MKKKDIIEVKIDNMIFGGESQNITDFDQKVIMKGGIQGQKVRAVVQKKRKDKIQAKILELIEKSSLETEDVCNQFGRCGGCSILSVKYENQLKLKSKQLLDLFHKNGHIEIEDIEVVGSTIQKEYKNKMEFTFGNEVKDGELVIGLHRKNSSMSIISVEDCYIIDEDYRKILKVTAKYFEDKNLPHYHIMSHEGYLRHLVVRKGINTGEILVNIVTTSQIDFDLKEYAENLFNIEFEGELVGILHTTNDSFSDTVTAEKVEILQGRDYFYDILLGKKFKISPFSFFQTNTKGAELLYKTAIDMIDGEKNTIFDLYSGTGTIGISLSNRAKKVIGIEIIEEAVEMAKENATRNNVENIEFISGDVKEEVIKLLNTELDITNENNIENEEKSNDKEKNRNLKTIDDLELNDKLEEKYKLNKKEFMYGDLQENERIFKCKKNNIKLTPDLIILDPPRAGINPKALQDIIGFNSKEILYISCNPKMLVQDLTILKESGYEIKKIKGVDMFPNTNHVECVVLLTKVQK